VLELQRGAGNQAVTRMLQRMPVRTDPNAREEVKKALVAKGYKDEWSKLVNGIGSLTIRDDVGIDNLARILVQQNNDVDRVIRVINIATPADLQDLATNPGTVAVFRELGNLVSPTDVEVDKAYVNFLANNFDANDLGLGASYVPGMYDTFRTAMLAGGGQYFDYNARTFRPLTEALRAQHAAGAPMGGLDFSRRILGINGAGHQLNLATGQVTAIANWQQNPNASNRELQLALGAAVAVPPAFNRPWNAETRRAIAAAHAHPAAALHVIAGGNPGPDLNTLIRFVAGAAQPARAMQVMSLVAGNAPVGNTFTNAINHFADIDQAAADIVRLRNHTLTNLPFGNRAGALRGHFLKHPLGRQDPQYLANGRWEGAQWMARLGLAPNGLITRGHLPNLWGHRLYAEWSIFAQHSHTYAGWLAWYGHAINPASTPTNAAETDALIGHLQGNLADATHLAIAFENLYGTDVSQAFDNAPNRFLYYDRGVLKVNAHDGTLFMVAAWNGATFDLSTGFMPQGGPAAQYAVALNANQRILDV